MSKDSLPVFAPLHNALGAFTKRGDFKKIDKGTDESCGELLMIAFFLPNKNFTNCFLHIKVFSYVK